MRNLKRALSLALAAVMVIGMMVIGAGATSLTDFPDKDEIKNQDAVSLLSTLGIVNGKDTGKFDPTGNVTRAEMAKMLSVIMNNGVDNNALYSSMTTKLTDIGSSWAKGHINFCYSRDIITGRGNNTFDPTANVTGAEAAKMLLVAAGYNPTTEGFVGSAWSINVSAKASALGIYQNFSKNIMEPLNRDDAALLIYNAMDIEMIQKYENGYAIAYEDSRTILSTMYGVYKVTGVVVANEYAALKNTDSDFAAAANKSTLEGVRVYTSTTKNTANGEYEEYKGEIVFNTPTTVDMLGRTVTMYAKKTTVLANSEILGVYLRDGDNVVKTTAETYETSKDFLKGTGLTTDAATAYYVNYGTMASEAAATKAMHFDLTTGRFQSANGNVNNYGVEMTAIDNDGDGILDYVLYLQETLTQIIATNTNAETTTLNSFNKNKAIDNDKFVTESKMAEGDVVLAVSYGGRYYVSDPEIITGKMDSFSSSKLKQQYIEVSGEKYYPSFINYAADAASNTYEFNILDCGKTDGVDFDITYDFIRDSNGSIIAYRPSEKGLYNFALILDSGYDPGRTNSNPSGEVKVLLPDGTQGTYTLNFDASAQNVGNQLYNGLGTASDRKADGIVELKGLLGSSVTDNTTNKPVDTTLLKTSGVKHFSNVTTANQSGHAAGYVIGYNINENKILTITSIVGSNYAAGAGNYTPTDSAKEKPVSVASTLSENYANGAARIKYDGKQITIDQNTVAFYYLPANQAPNTTNSAMFGVAVGYSKMSNLDKGVNFVSSNYKDTTLASTVLFEAEGVVAERDYAYILSRSSTVSGNVTLNAVLMDGTAALLKVSRSDFDSIFTSEAAFGTVYSYTTDGSGISTLTVGTDYMATEAGYVVKLRDGTVALYGKNADGTLGAYKDAYSYDKGVWNVEDVSAGNNAPAGAFAQNVYKETILVLDGKGNTVRAAYIKSVLSGETPDTGHDFDWNLSNYKDVYPSTALTDIQKYLTEGFNVKMNGDYTLGGNLYLPANRIFYVTGNLNEAGYHVETSGELWVQKNYNVNNSITVKTQVGGDMVLNNPTSIYSNVAVKGGITTIGAKNLTVESTGSVYVEKNVTLTGGTLTGGTLTIHGHIDAADYTTGNIVVDSSKTLIARGNVAAPAMTIGTTADAGKVEVRGNLTVSGILTLTKGNLSVSSATAKIGTLNTEAGTQVNAKNLTVDTAGTIKGSAVVSDTLTVTTALTVDTAGTLSTAKMAGTGVVTNNGSFTITTADKTSTVEVKGNLSGKIGSSVKLADTTTVAKGKSTTIEGDLTTANSGDKTLNVEGTLTLNGTVDKLTNVKSTTKGAKIVFGANAVATDAPNANFVYAKADGTASTDQVLKADIPGMTFVYSTDTAAGKFVATSDGRPTDDLSAINLTTPAADSKNTIGTNGKAVTVNVATGTTSVTLTVTKTKGQTITATGATVANTNDTTSTITVALNGTAMFNVVVAETGKTSITYAVTVTTEPAEEVGGLTPAAGSGAIISKVDAATKKVLLKNATDGDAALTLTLLSTQALVGAEGVYTSALGLYAQVPADDMTTAIDSSNVDTYFIKSGSDYYSIAFAAPDALAFESANKTSSTSASNANKVYSFTLTGAPDTNDPATTPSVKVYDAATDGSEVNSSAVTYNASTKVMTIDLGTALDKTTTSKDIWVYVAGAALNSERVKLTCKYMPEALSASITAVANATGGTAKIVTIGNPAFAKADTAITFIVYDKASGTDKVQIGTATWDADTATTLVVTLDTGKTFTTDATDYFIVAVCDGVEGAPATASIKTGS